MAKVFSHHIYYKLELTKHNYIYLKIVLTKNNCLNAK